MTRTIRTTLALVLVLAVALFVAFHARAEQARPLRVAGDDGRPDRFRAERAAPPDAQRVIPISDGLRLVVDAVKDGEAVGHLEARIDGAWLGVSVRDPNARFVIPAR